MLCQSLQLCICLQLCGREQMRHDCTQELPHECTGSCCQQCRAQNARAHPGAKLLRIWDDGRFGDSDAYSVSSSVSLWSCPHKTIFGTFLSPFMRSQLKVFCVASIQLRPISDYDMLTVGRSARDLLRKKIAP